MKEELRQPEGKLEDQPKEIKDAQSFNELFEILEHKGGISGNNGQKYVAGVLRAMVQKIRDDLQTKYTRLRDEDPLERLHLVKGDLQKLPDTDGFRDKVSELIYKSEKKDAEWFDNERKKNAKKYGS